VSERFDKLGLLKALLSASFPSFMMNKSMRKAAGRAVSRRRGSVLALVVALSLPWMTACGKGGEAPSGAAPAGGPAGGGGVPVEAVTLANKPVDDVAEFVGTLRSRRSTTIQPQAEGFLTKIQVKSGDRVAPGATLFEIDSATQQAAVASLESVRAARQSDAAYAEQQAKRAKSLLDVGAASQQEYEQAASQQKTAVAQLKAADEQIRQAQSELAYHRVTAPAAGIVGDVPVRQGDRVTRTTVLTTIDDNTGLEVYVNVPVQDAPKVKLGQTIRLLTETGETLATEKVNFIAPSVDDATQTVLVKAPISQSGGRFRTEQFVRSQIVFGSAEGLTVPLVSALRINGQYFVYVAEGGVAKQRAVTLGRVVGNEYVVVGGLKPGEKLIVSGIQKIGDGAPVTLMPPAAPGPAPAAPAGGRGQ
jgi:RND family efflux transporter MFP subunit